MRYVELRSASIIEDTSGKLWLPLSDLQHDQIAGDKPELIRVGDDYYDVEGYSMKRRCFWIRRIQVEGSADNIEDEMAEYLDELQ